MFKEIKNKLIADNKIKRYLTYAFGEVLLIVLGIMIAMNLDDWNENRKNIATAKTLINEIRFDLKNDTTIFGTEIRKIDVFVKYKKMLLSKDSIANLETKDIISILTIGYHNLKISDGTYENMKESEVLTLNEYKDFFKKIKFYYKFQNSYLANLNEWEVNLYERDLNQWVFQNQVEIEFEDITANVQNNIEKREKLISLLQTPICRNTLKLSISKENKIKNIYLNIKNNATKLLKKADSISKK